MSARARNRGFLGAADLPALLWLLAFALAAAYLTVFVVQLPYNIAQLGWNSSVASAFVMPETLVKTGTGGNTVMGSTGQWVSLWFGLLTAGLPLHRELWGVAPTLLFFATAFIVGWSVAQLAGRRAACLAVLIGLVASVPALGFLMAPFSHNTIYPCTALLGAYLIWLSRCERRRRRLSTLALPPLLGVVIGTCLASDILLAVAALVPLALTAALASLRRDRRSWIVALSALTTIVVSIPIAKLTSTIMGSLGYVTLPTPFKLAAVSELPMRAKLLFEGLKYLFNGYLGSREGAGTLHAPLGIASDIVMSAALLTLLVVGVRTAVRLVSYGLRKRDLQTPTQFARSLHIVYWVSSAAATCGAFWIAGEGPTTTHYSYYDTVVFAVAAVIPLLVSAGRQARRLIAIGASVFFLGGLVGLTSDYFTEPAALSVSAKTIMRLAVANDVSAGYANWTDASGLTWGMHSRVTLRPVVECETQQGIGLCPGFQAYVPAWYVPRQRRTFLLVEANGVELASPPADLGKPLAVYTFESMRMYVYPYDIASRFGAPE